MRKNNCIKDNSRKTFYGDVPNGNKDIWKVENPRYFLL